MGAAAVHPSFVASLPLHSCPPTPLRFSHFWCKGRFLSSNLYHNLEKKYKAQFPGSPKSLIFWPEMHPTPHPGRSHDRQSPGISLGISGVS